MKHTLVLFALFCFSFQQVIGQIDIVDSSVQVISYWNQNEVQNYSLTIEKIKLTGADTTSREFTSYQFELSVVDSTANSYTLQWHYKDVQSGSPDPSIQKIMALSKDMKIVYRTSETGEFIEVVNWKELKDLSQKASSSLKAELKGSTELGILIMQFENSYASKSSIESVAIKEIKQFHTYHGAKYKLGDILEGQQKVPNLYGTEPFDLYTTVYLDEINTEDGNFILRSVQNIDNEQLTNATFEYLSKTAKNMNVTPPKKEDFKELINETTTASRIHEGGWVIYSVQTVVVNSGNATNIEERIIEIK